LAIGEGHDSHHCPDAAKVYAGLAWAVTSEGSSHEPIAAPALTDPETGIAVPVAALAHFAIPAPTTVTQGVGFNLTLTAEDAFGNVVTGSRGTVHLSSTDAKDGAQNFTFSNNDNGVHIFSYTFNAMALQTITITDTTNSSILGSLIVDVLAQAGVGGGGGPRVSSARPAAEWTGLLVSWEDVDGFPVVAT
jgi:hypothetical protein